MGQKRQRGQVEYAGTLQRGERKYPPAKRLGQQKKAQQIQMGLNLLGMAE